MTQSNTKQPLDVFISRLYRSTQSVSIEHFREWALKELQTLISFDAAIWSTGHLSTRIFHTHTTLGLPKTFPDELLASLSINPIRKELFKHVGEAVDMEDVVQDDVFYQSDIYHAIFKKNHINRILSSIDIDKRSGVYTLLSIYRHDKSHSFLPEEKRIYQHALFHLKEAASHACMLSLKDHSDGHLAHYAICDDHGVYHEAESAFLDLIDDLFSEHQAQTLPFSLPRQGDKKTLNSLIIQSKKLGDLYRVSIRQESPLDTLTQREQEVVEGVTQGLSFKQIGKKLSLSPSTVSNHLYRIYQKLDINNRSQLADLIQKA